jgi:hypothetical protein
VADAVGDRLPAGAVPVEVTVLQFYFTNIHRVSSIPYLAVTCGGGPVARSAAAPAAADFEQERVWTDRDE